MQDSAGAADRLAQFLVRIQTRSEAHPDLDGAWYRCFDYKRWDYWASNADSGWGGWCTETGWTQAWIIAGLVMRQSKTCLWELTSGSKIATHFEKYRKRMIPDESLARAAAAGILKHLALGKAVTLATPADPRHPGIGAAGLTDGVRNNLETGAYSWMGFEGVDFVAEVDLDRALTIRRFGADFYQFVQGSVFLPRLVEFSVSDDGKTFRTVATVKNDIPLDREGPLTKTIWAEVGRGEGAIRKSPGRQRGNDSRPGIPSTAARHGCSLTKSSYNKPGERAQGDRHIFQPSKG